MTEVQFLSDGVVALRGWQGNDLSVVNSARVSFGKRKLALDEADEGLIRFLLENRHGTPFEHNSFTFHVQCPIFVAREWFRHRIGSFNEFSMRYSEWEPKFFVPKPKDVRTQVGKPGAYSYEEFDQTKARKWIVLVTKHFEESYALYRDALSHGVAKEQARIVLPVAAFTEFFWTVNARSLMNFLSLRNAPAAMREIRAYAEAIEHVWGQKMPVTKAAFLASGRTAP